MVGIADISEDGSHASHLVEEIDQLHSQNSELWRVVETVRQENAQVRAARIPHTQKRQNT